jgi:death on curing protein
MAESRFLALEEVLAIHADQLERYGGASGVRDVGLLESAIALPRATFDGRYLHESDSEIAAAYLFALTFLWLQGRELDAPPDELYELVIGVAAGRVTKAEAAVFIARHWKTLK